MFLISHESHLLGSAKQFFSSMWSCLGLWNLRGWLCAGSSSRPGSLRISFLEFLHMLWASLSIAAGSLRESSKKEGQKLQDILCSCVENHIASLLLCSVGHRRSPSSPKGSGKRLLFLMERWQNHTPEKHVGWELLLQPSLEITFARAV